MSSQKLTFKVYESPCSNCLLTPDRIVSPERMKQIINECVKNDNYFICHKASMQDLNIACHSFYKTIGVEKIQIVQIADRIGMTEFVPMLDDEKLTPHKNYRS
jgi:hypothetical protein